MYDQYVLGRRYYKPYVVSDKDIAMLRRRLKKETKVMAVVIAVQNDGYLTQEQIADLAGITRMTLFRWRTTNKKFQREIERLSDKAFNHWRKESRKRNRMCTSSLSDVLSDARIYRALLGL